MAWLKQKKQAREQTFIKQGNPILACPVEQAEIKIALWDENTSNVSSPVRCR
jgi:Zn ribbon nucleic-acid-binding protein